MKNFLTIIFLLLLICLHVIPDASAQTSIDWSGELRLRTEIDGRNFDLETPANSYTLSRTRLGAFIQPARDIGFFLQIQDSRVFGFEPGYTDQHGKS
jgi:hypothetical protein